MFSKGNKSDQKSSSGNTGRSLTAPKLTSSVVAPSIVSANLRVTGDLESDGDIQIDGVVEGDVRSESVTVGEHAIVAGAIVAQTVRVSGTVKGQINGKLVELARSARVTGDIVHESLAIEAGAFIQGLCRHAEGSGQLAKDGDVGGKEQSTPNRVAGNGNGNGNGGNGEVIGEDADKKAKATIAATAAKGQEAVKKVFR